jgi:hypothetical protein
LTRLVTIDGIRYSTGLLEHDWHARLGAALDGAASRLRAFEVDAGLRQLGVDLRDLRGAASPAGWRGAVDAITDENPLAAVIWQVGTNRHKWIRR